MGPNHWTAIMLKEYIPNMEWVPPGCFIDEEDFYGFPVYLVESPDLMTMAIAQQQPGYHFHERRDYVLMNFFDCQDPGRVGVRHEHLEALAAATSLGEFQAARAAIQADTGYPPAAGT